MTPTQRGSLAVIAAMFVYVINDSFVKLVSERLPISEIMVIRGLFSVIMAVIWVKLAGDLGEISNGLKSKLIVGRGFLEGLIAFTFMTAVAQISLPDINAILLLSPLFITALSVPLLGQKVGWRRWSAIGLAFVGMLFVMKPSGQSLGIAGLIALSSAILVALRDIMTYKVKDEYSSVVMMLFSNIAVFLTGVALSPFQVWVMPQFIDILFLLLAALLVTIGNYFVVIAYRGVNVAVVSAFRYSVIIFAMIAGFVVWGDKPDGLGLFGTFLIVLSGLYSLFREAALKRGKI